MREQKAFSLQSGLLSSAWSFTPYLSNHHFSGIGWFSVLNVKQKTKNLTFSSLLTLNLGAVAAIFLRQAGRSCLGTALMRDKTRNRLTQKVDQAVSGARPCCGLDFVLIILLFQLNGSINFLVTSTELDSQRLTSSSKKSFQASWQVLTIHILHSLFTFKDG